jgi:hypothetical protein
MGRWVPFGERVLIPTGVEPGLIRADPLRANETRGLLQPLRSVDGAWREPSASTTGRAVLCGLAGPERKCSGPTLFDQGSSQFITRARTRYLRPQISPCHRTESER